MRHSIGRRKQAAHVGAVGDDVLPVKSMGGELLHPPAKYVVRLGLDVINELLGVDIDATSTRFGRDYRQADVESAVNFAFLYIDRILAVYQNAFVENEITLKIIIN